MTELGKAWVLRRTDNAEEKYWFNDGEYQDWMREVRNASLLRAEDTEVELQLARIYFPDVPMDAVPVVILQETPEQAALREALLALGEAARRMYYAEAPVHPWIAEFLDAPIERWEAACRAELKVNDQLREATARVEEPTS